MIKKLKTRIFLNSFLLFFLINTFAYSLSPEYEKQLYVGCYTNSKIYIGNEKAKEYCTCTIKMLSKKFTDQQIDILFKKQPAEIEKETQFAALYCEKSNKAQ